MRALAHRNYRFYFVGQAVSILGSWIQQVSLAWLVYRITGSAALLGVTAFCALVPQLLVGPLAGAWIDKQDKKKWLLAAQALLAVQAFVLAFLTWMDWIGPTLIVLMSLLLGLVNSFDTPLRQSLINSFVGRSEDLPNALALNAMLFNASRFIGPPLAGRFPTGLFRQLYAFKMGFRNGTQAAFMKPVVQLLDEQDMIALAAYAASLDP